MPKEPPFKFTIEVKNVSGHDLTAKDSNGLSDPYFTITFPIIQGTPVYKSRVISKTLDPVWENEEFSYLYEANSDVTNSKHTMVINVYDKDMLSSDFIGSVSIPLYSLFIGPVRNEFSIYDGTKYAGAIKFEFEAKQLCEPIFTLSNMKLGGCKSSESVPVFVYFTMSPFPDVHNYTYFDHNGDPKTSENRLRLPQSTVDTLVSAYAIFKVGTYEKLTNKRELITSFEYPLSEMIGRGRMPRAEITRSNNKAVFTATLDAMDFPIAAQMTLGCRVNAEYRDTVKYHPNFPHPTGHVEKTPAKPAPHPPAGAPPPQNVVPSPPPPPPPTTTTQQFGFPQQGLNVNIAPQKPRSPPPQQGPVSPPQQEQFPPLYPQLPPQQQPNQFPPFQEPQFPPQPRKMSPPPQQPQYPPQQPQYQAPPQQQPQYQAPPQQQPQYQAPPQQQPNQFPPFQQPQFPPQQRRMSPPPQQPQYPPQQPQYQAPPQQQPNQFPPFQEPQFPPQPRKMSPPPQQPQYQAPPRGMSPPPQQPQYPPQQPQYPPQQPQYPPQQPQYQAPPQQQPNQFPPFQQPQFPTQQRKMSSPPQQPQYPPQQPQYPPPQQQNMGGLGPDFIQRVDANGRVYYMNVRTGEVRY